ncbi:MAG TPA: hypothetical protein VH276_03125, partial [Solirubrobacteraceae bacterium]|nr:hypothetical protein [Solirubrobacteraceae bacterium]
TSQRRTILAIDPASGRVARAGRLPVAISDAGAASFADHITVAGGRTAAGAVQDEVWTLAR